MPATLLCAQFTDKELTLRKQARADARPTLPIRPPPPGHWRWPSAR